MSARLSQRAVAVVEMEVERQLFWGGLPHIAAIATALLGG
jgi:hypothetical protein